MSSKDSAGNISKEVKEMGRDLLSYCKLQDEEIKALENRAKWLFRSQIAILLYLIFI